MFYAEDPYKIKNAEVNLLLYITTVPVTKLFAGGRGPGRVEDMYCEKSRGLCGLVCPSRTSQLGSLLWKTVVVYYLL